MKIKNSEVVIGIITTVGTDTSNAIKYIEEHLKKFSYETIVINVSSQIISKFDDPKKTIANEYDRINYYMDLGDKVRNETGDGAILAKGVAATIHAMRDVSDPQPRNRCAYIVKSLKHPKESEYLKDVYGDGFHLVGITSKMDKRIEFLTNVKNIQEKQARKLIERDTKEDDKLGQQTLSAFQNSDYFLDVTDNLKELRNSVFRLIDILFGDPFVTPTFDEYAMFMAYASSLRSADLSRQVGAVITKGEEIISSGANDCPKYGGGLYWQIHKDNSYYDLENGRDYKIGYDSNKHEQEIIINSILSSFNLEINEENKQKIKDAGIGSLTEYGRVVHAEMESLLMCARNNISTKNTTMYVTTFPCHNCAKHIIASGVEKVIYIEPYPKSKAIDFYSQEITTDGDVADKVRFVPFSGVGPRRFVDLFSMNSTKWESKTRKDKDGKIINWDRTKANLRNPLYPMNYIEFEAIAYKNYYEEISNNKKE